MTPSPIQRPEWCGSFYSRLLRLDESDRDAFCEPRGSIGLLVEDRIHELVIASMSAAGLAN